MVKGMDGRFTGDGMTASHSGIMNLHIEWKKPVPFRKARKSVNDHVKVPHLDHGRMPHLCQLGILLKCALDSHLSVFQ